MELKTKYLLILLAIGILLFLFKIGERDLWEPDETRYAVVAREMRQSGNWIVPHLSGALYAEKPPLYFWLVNLSTIILGKTTESANRLPSALAGFIAVLLTFHFGSKLFNPSAGFLSGLVLSTCFFFPNISRWMMLDSLFCLLFLLSVYHLYIGMSSQGRQRFHFLLAGIWVALGTLTKGPLGFLPIPLLFIYSAMVGEFRRIWNRNLLYGVLLAIGMVMAWIIPAVSIAGKSYGTENVLHQTVGRFAGGWSHPQPFYFYLTRFPVGFLPWVIFLPWAVSYGFSQIGAEKKKEILLLLVWFVFIFLFFSLSKGKKENYLLPLYPPAAILVGGWLSSCWDSRKERRRLWIPMILVTLLFLTAWFVILLRPYKLPEGIEAYLSFGVWPLLAIGLGAVLSLFLLTRSSGLSLFCLIAGLIIAQVQLMTVIPSRLNKERSLKPFSRRILLRMGPEDQLTIWKFQSTGLLYYTEKPVEQIKSFDRFLKVFCSSNRVFMVAEREDLTRLRERVDVTIYPVEKAKVAHRELLLVSNQPAQ